MVVMRGKREERRHTGISDNNIYLAHFLLDNLGGLLVILQIGRSEGDWNNDLWVLFR
jgi:hypothetical protein